MSVEEGLVELHGYPVRPERRAFAELLFEACERTGARDSNGEPNLRQLAESVHRAPTTLINNLTNKNGPELSTLTGLAAATGIPIERWLVSLNVLPPRGTPRQLSVARQRWLDIVNGYRDEDVDDMARTFYRLRGTLQPDSSPTPAPKE